MTTNRIWTLALSISLGLTLAGCLLLSPDERPREPFELRVIAVDDGALSKGPCQDPGTLLRRPTEELSARAILYRQTEEDRAAQRKGTEIFRGDLRVGELIGGQRELTAKVDVPVSPTSRTLIDVELFYTGSEGHEPLGDYVGSVIFESGAVVTVTSFFLQEDLGGDRYAGEVEVRFATSEGARTDFDEVFFDRASNELTASYLIENVDWNDDSDDLKTILAEMSLEFAPPLIFAAEGVDLGQLVPGASEEALDPIRLSPVASPVPIGNRLVGRVDVRFTNGTPPREFGVVRLQRVDTSCDQ